MRRRVRKRIPPGSLPCEQWDGLVAGEPGERITPEKMNERARLRMEFYYRRFSRNQIFQDYYGVGKHG